MPLAGKRRTDLRITLPDVSSRWNSPVNAAASLSNSKMTTSLAHSGLPYDARLNDHEARAIRGEQTECSDELDLVSECSSPCSYTPGKYLQLCDIVPSDVMEEVTLFPGTSRLSAVNGRLEEVSLLETRPTHTTSLDFSSLRKTTQESPRTRVFPIVSNKTLLVVALAVVVALTALGCLATVI